MDTIEADANVAPCPVQGDLIGRIIAEDLPALRRFVLAATRNVEDTDDILQDLVIRILQNQSALPTARSRRAYLVTMARNLMLDRHRGAAAQARAIADLATREADTVTPAFQERVLCARQGASAVDRAMARLQPRHRQIYWLSRFDGCSSSDIADRMGISRRSVERHVSEVSVYIRDTLANCI